MCSQERLPGHGHRPQLGHDQSERHCFNKHHWIGRTNLGCGWLHHPTSGSPSIWQRGGTGLTIYMSTDPSLVPPPPLWVTKYLVNRTCMLCSLFKGCVQSLKMYTQYVFHCGVFEQCILSNKCYVFNYFKPVVFNLYSSVTLNIPRPSTQAMLFFFSCWNFLKCISFHACLIRQTSTVNTLKKLNK